MNITRRPHFNFPSIIKILLIAFRLGLKFYSFESIMSITMRPLSLCIQSHRSPPPHNSACQMSANKINALVMFTKYISHCVWPFSLLRSAATQTRGIANSIVYQLRLCVRYSALHHHVPAKNKKNNTSSVAKILSKNERPAQKSSRNTAVITLSFMYKV